MPNDFCLKVGSRVRANRLNSGFTQEELAEKVGVSWSTISRLERGHLMVSIERLLDICRVLNVGLEAILCDYMEFQNLFTDDESQQILKLLTLLTPQQKKYLYDNIRLVIEHFGTTK